MWHRIDDPENPPPKDGAWILVNDTCGPGIVVAHWSSWRNGGKEYFGWQGDECGCGGYAYTPHPTHWMPLPPPPAEDTP